MRYVVEQGELYKVPDVNWCKFVRAMASDPPTAGHICNYGKKVADVEDVTDWEQWQAEDELERISSRTL